MKINNKKELNDMEREIRISHALTVAMQRLSVPEKRIVMLAVSQMHKQYTSNEVFRTEVSASDLAQCSEISQEAAYTELKRACDTHSDGGKPILTRRYVKWEPSDTRKKWVTVVPTVEYDSNPSRARLTFNPDINPHISDLGKYFTSYYLKGGMRLRKGYSWRLYELLMKWNSSGGRDRLRGRGGHKFSISQLKHSLGIPDEKYQVASDMTKRVIKPAIMEINEKNNMDIEWATYKDGKKVAGFDFDFTSVSTPFLDKKSKKSNGRKVATKNPVSNKTSQKITGDNKTLSHRELDAKLRGAKQMGELGGWSDAIKAQFDDLKSQWVELTGQEWVGTETPKTKKHTPDPQLEVV